MYMPMYCPNCNKEMKPVTQKIWDEIDWDEPKFEIGAHTCEDCGVKYNESPHRRAYNKPEWELPDSLKPTEKQIRTEAFIRNKFSNNISEYPITKRQYIKFIEKYFNKAKEKVR